ncbi:MAG: hypothetical protein DRK00_11630 [Thermoprotei archaeon]|nr:MAG: hypothetical protein DRK00_11630 [Thermoprotei archaeon]
MRIEVEGRVFELDWKEGALLLVLKWLEWHAMTMKDAILISRDRRSTVKIIEKLSALGLVKEYRFPGMRIIVPTPLGLKVADAIEELAAEVGIDVEEVKRAHGIS